MKKCYLAGKILLLILIMLWTLFPVYWMVSLSFRNSGELAAGLSLLPRSLTPEHFINLFGKHSFLRSVINSLQVTLISTAASLAFGLSAAYILARLRFRYALRGPLLFWSFLIRILPPVAFALPLYIMMNRLGLLNTKIPLILSHILINIPFVLWFMISFFNGVPEAMEESGKMDGAGEGLIFIKIILPLVAPGIAASGILSFMTSWNEYLYGAIFVQSPSQFTIPLNLSTLNSEQELTQWGTLCAGGVLSLVPVALFILFTQNLLIQGLSSGSVKE